MLERHAKLSVHDGQGTVELDGVRKLVLDAGVGVRPRLTVELLVHEIEVDGKTEVTVPVKTREALVALGWTPPPEERTARPKGEVTIVMQPDDAAFARGVHAAVDELRRQGRWP